jgi:hypothetical protein
MLRIRSRGVTRSSNFLSGRLETDAIALHGDERYCRLSGMGLSWPAQHPIMNKPSKTPNISRIDQPAHHTHGFFLRAARQGEIFSGFFSDKAYGGRAAALAAAQEHRGKLLKILGLPIHKSRRLNAEIVRRMGRSGIYGVQRVIDRKVRPWRKYWQAAWSPELGVVRKKQFSIRKFGEEEALRRAIRTRRAGVRSMKESRDAEAGK